MRLLKRAGSALRARSTKKSREASKAEARWGGITITIIDTKLGRIALETTEKRKANGSEW
jgi:hypothetical protein